VLKGKTKSGFTYQISEKRLENYELVEALNAIETNPLEVIKVVNLLLGVDQAKKLKEHLRDKDGLVSTEKMTNEIQEIFETQATLKNS